MNEVLMNIDITQRTIYLAIILVIMGEGLKNISFIRKWMVLWLLFIVSVLINFLFYGISFSTFFGALIAISFAVFVYDAYMQTKKGINEIRYK